MITRIWNKLNKLLKVWNILMKKIFI